MNGALAITATSSTSVPMDDVYALRWANTADRLLFSALPDGSLPNNWAGKTDLWVMDLSDPANPVNITNDSVDEASPSWSPDDRRVAYLTTGICVRPSDGSGTGTLITTDSSAWMPSWRRNP